MWTRRGLGSMLATGVAAARAAAQGNEAANYPNRVVTMVVPWAAGGSTDAIGRVLAARLSTDLGQAFVVENRGGASGTIGAALVARAKPDGYTLLLNGNSTYAIAPHLYRLPYDNDRAFAYGGLLASQPIFMVVPKASPATDVASYVALAKRSPGQLQYGSAGAGSSTHIATEMWLGMAQLEIPDVAYRSGAPLVQGLLSNEVSMAFQAASGVLPYIRSGDLRALAVSTRERSTLAPEVPTLHEQGYADFEALDLLALFGPAGTPAPILHRLNAACAAAFAAPEVRERLDTLGVVPTVQLPEAFPAHAAAESAKARDVVQARNIRVQ